jgi:large subunit ribosomal protein L9
MQIILTDNVVHLGKVGDVVKVKDGYARNYLLPRDMAVTATPANMKRIEKEKSKRLAMYEENKKEAQKKADELSKVSLTIAVEVNDQEKLYGAISETEIIKAFEIEGQKVEKKALVIEKAIEELGIFEIGVKLHPEVVAKIRLWVTKQKA